MKHIKKFESFRPINEEVPMDMEYSKQYSPNCNWNPEERSELEKLGADSIGDSDATFIEDDETYEIKKYAENTQSQTSKCLYSVRNINNVILGYGGFLKINRGSIASFQNAVNILRDAIVAEKSPEFKEQATKRKNNFTTRANRRKEEEKKPWYKNIFSGDRATTSSSPFPKSFGLG